MCSNVYLRRLRGGDWLLGQEDNVPIVLKGSKELSREQVEKYLYSNETITEATGKNNSSVLIVDTASNSNSSYSDDSCTQASIQIVSRIVFWTLVIVSVFYSCFTLFNLGVPSGLWWVHPDKNIFLSVGVVIATALSTSIFHELGHMIYGNSKQTSFSFVKAIVKIKLNHIWGWPTGRRMEAIAAGIGIDFCSLAICLALLTATNSWILFAASATIVVRILWQFGFHAHRDGRLLVCVLKDDPTYFTDGNKYSSVTLKFMGVLLDLFLLFWWPIKFLFS